MARPNISNSTARNIRLDDQLWDELEVAAKRSGVSRARFIRIVLTKYMKTNNLADKRGRPPGPDYEPAPEHDLRGENIK